MKRGNFIKNEKWSKLDKINDKSQILGFKKSKLLIALEPTLPASAEMNGLLGKEFEFNFKFLVLDLD